jgi:hypothetical protein
MNTGDEYAAEWNLMKAAKWTYITRKWGKRDAASKQIASFSKQCACLLQHEDVRSYLAYNCNANKPNCIRIISAPIGPLKFLPSNEVIHTRNAAPW